MYCRNCGSPLPDGTRFCPSCGTPAEASEDRTTVMAGPRHAAQGHAGPSHAAPASRTAVGTPSASPSPTKTMRMPRAQAGDPARTQAAAPVPSPRRTDPYAQPDDRRPRSSGRGAAVAVALVALLAVAALALYFLVVAPSNQESSTDGADDPTAASVLDSLDDLVGTGDEVSGDDATSDSADASDDAAGGSDDATASDGKGGGTSGTSGSASVSYGSYSNVRFGFTVDVPSSFSSFGESGDGDGATFEDSSTGAALLVWGSNNSAGLSVEEVADSYAEGHDLIDRAVSGSAFDLWYRSGGSVVRLRGLVGSGSYCVVQFEYPEADAQQLAPVSDRVANSLVAGDLTTAH